MTERERLYRAIIDNPGDDAARLVYADWLEEYGDASQRIRAEFIRVQCELSGSGANDPDLLARERELIRLNAWTWLRDAMPESLHREFDRWEEKGPLVISKRDDDLAILFRRGFIESVVTTIYGAREVLPDLVKLSPIRHVVVRHAVHGGIIFRGDGFGDIPRDFWAEIGLDRHHCLTGRCCGGLPSLVHADMCAGRGTHAYFGTHSLSEWNLSKLLLEWARKTPTA